MFREGSFLILVVSISWLLAVNGQTAPDNRGTEFIIGFMENYLNDFPLELFVTTSRTTQVSVRVWAPKSSNPKLDTKFTVTAGFVKQITFSVNFRLTGTEMSNKGILVTASDEIVIYGINKQRASNDGFLGLPTDVLGKEYYATTYAPAYRYCLLLVVGVHDKTNVNIRLGDNSGVSVSYAGKKYGRKSTIKVTINRYTTFQIHSKGDLTGSYVTSDKPISFFSGNKKTNIGKGGSQDHLVEHQVPVDNWGKKFATVPIPDRVVGDYFRFVASESKTKITVKGMKSGKTTVSETFTINNPGEWKQKHYASGCYTYVVSDKPILLVQYVLSQVGDKADPAMIIIPPIEQYAADYTFTTPKYTQGSYYNYFLFIVKDKEKDGLRMNGAKFPSGTKYNKIPGTDLVGGYVKLVDGTHTCRHTSPISIFGGFLYGRQHYESYAFTTGMRLAPINKPCIKTKTVTGDGIDNDCDGLIDEELCHDQWKGTDDDKDGARDEDCAKPPPIDGKWASWGSWGRCSLTCSNSGSQQGTKTRIRSCSNPAPKYDGKQCVGSDSQSTSCTTSTMCPVHGKWGSWGGYGSCTKTCGGGTRTRTRSCNNPAPKYGGNNCPGSGSYSQSCNTAACPVDGKWSAWSSWTKCSVACGGGSQKRSRSCTNPAPKYGGKGCSGSTSASQSCNTQSCAIHGKWGNWGSYGSCSKSCGGGTKTRTRSCNNPAPRYGGNNCAGSGSSSTACNTGACPIHGKWAAWGSWKTCSVTCGGGSQKRSRTCTNPSPQYGGKACSGSSSSVQSCNTQACPIDGNWGKWGAWKTCSVTCGGGTQGRSRSCSNPTPKYGGKSCSGSSSSSQSCNTHACPIDGSWGKWGAWKTCSVTCGSGTQKRARSCSSPAPQHGGKSCSGSSSSSQSCNTHACPIDGNWGRWGAWKTCSVTCGGGIQERTRSCSNPAPQHGGKSCGGSLSSSQSCNSHPCPIDGNWGRWGAWKTCSVTCGGGTQDRTRSCSNPAPQHGGKSCGGSLSSSQSCNSHPCPIDGNWGRWGAWKTCSVTCGGGTQDRTRSCSNPAPQHGGKSCGGSLSSSQSCNSHPCPIDGNWGRWGAWKTCSVTCGGGTQDRTRSCSNPAPQHGGKSCGGSLSSTQSCNTHNCPIDGKWGSWSAWATCSVTCGGGRQGRTRTCSNPAPQYGGADCGLSSSSSQACNTHHCPIDGKWGSWSAWATCSVTCGGGRQGRTRTCSNPAPQYGGADCGSRSSSSQACNTHHCPIDGVWASWSSWGTCSETCGGGIQTRSRSCTDPAPQYGGKACPGTSSSAQTCNSHHCPIDGAWSTWNAWGTCSVTCGGGSQSRSRTCTNPVPQYGGANCGGSGSSTQICNTQHCPIDGGLSSWSAWGTCTVTCGGGSQIRTRSCTNPAPQYGGAPCTATTSDSQSCNTQVCIIDGAWADWGSWGTCSVTCGGGQQSRSRTCTNPKPANGGQICSGDSAGMQDCNTQACPTVAAGQYQQKCPTGYFTCQAGGMTCIDESFKCDCSKDCDDGSDETETYAGCSPQLATYCPNGASGISPMSLAFLLMTTFLAMFFNSR